MEKGKKKEHEGGRDRERNVSRKVGRMRLIRDKMTWKKGVRVVGRDRGMKG